MHISNNKLRNVVASQRDNFTRFQTNTHSAAACHSMLKNFFVFHIVSHSTLRLYFIIIYLVVGLAENGEIFGKIVVHHGIDKGVVNLTRVKVIYIYMLCIFCVFFVDKARIGMCRRPIPPKKTETGSILEAMGAMVVVALQHKQKYDMMPMPIHHMLLMDSILHTNIHNNNLNVNGLINLCDMRWILDPFLPCGDFLIIFGCVNG